MTNAVFPKYKQSVITEADANNGLNGSGTSGVFALLIDLGTYSYDAADQYFSDISGVVPTGNEGVEITTPTVVGGLFDGDNCTFSSVTGNSCEAIILFRKNTGANTTWRLVLFEDTDVNGLPVTPNGGNIIIAWDAAGIFTISDRNLKENIREVGHLGGEVGVYEFNYVGSERLMRGLMAQEVERVVPDAVVEYERGRKAVNYALVLEALSPGW